MGVSSFRFIDLFAGLGGFHRALTKLGGEVVFAAEWDETLNALYKDNFDLKPWGDINKLDPQAVPDHDVLAAGFPCQPFSKAGVQLGFEHTHQGQLFFKVRDILEAKQPRRFILENVPNILNHRAGETLKTIESSLRSLGYEIDSQRLSPHHFGVPQIRDRAYFVGSLDGLDGFDWPQPSDEETDVTSVLEKNVTSTRKIPTQTLAAIDIWDDFLKSSPPSVKLPSFPIWGMEFRATYPYKDATPAALIAELGTKGLDKYLGSFGAPLRGLSVADQLAAIPSHGRREGDYKFPGWKIAFIRDNRKFYEDNRNWIDPWLERSRLWELPPSLQKFEWNAQGCERRIDKYVLQVRASGLRVKRTTTAPSLIAMTTTQVPILGWDRRYMTPEECAKLQCLDGIKLPTSDIHAYKALGNAVNAQVVQKIAEPLVRGLDDPAAAAA